jgi:hypothetical protein
MHGLWRRHPPAINRSALRHQRHGDPQKLCQEALASGRRAWQQCALTWPLVAISLIEQVSRLAAPGNRRSKKLRAGEPKLNAPFGLGCERNPHAPPESRMSIASKYPLIYRRCQQDGAQIRPELAACRASAATMSYKS